MRLLAIETSCDDASVAIVEGESLDRPVKVLAERTASQVELGKKYGGVFPELAAREHFTTLLPTIEEMLRVYSPDADPRDTLKGLDAIAVTAGPGLIGSLLVGVTVAQALAMGLGKKLIPVNHLAGHIYSAFLEDAEVVSGFPPLQKGDQRGFEHQSPDKISPHPSLQRGESDSAVPEFPLLALTVSGGHTQLVWMEDHGQFEVLGRTRDDAAGEAFDKVSVMLGLGYPGGPAIQLAAAAWANGKWQTANGSIQDAIHFPRPMIDEGLEFSFSGLKTAVRYWLEAAAPGTLAKWPKDSSEVKEVQTPPSRDCRAMAFWPETGSFGCNRPATSRLIKPDRPCRRQPVSLERDSLSDPKAHCPTVPSNLIAEAAYEVQEAITDVLVTKLLRAANERRPKSIILAGGVAANTRLREKLLESIAVRGSRFAVSLTSRQHSTDNGAMIGAAALAMLATGYQPVDPAHVEALSSWPLENWG